MDRPLASTLAGTVDRPTTEEPCRYSKEYLLAASNSVGLAAVTISNLSMESSCRFVTWRSIDSNVSVNDRQTINTFLNGIGADSVIELNGLQADSHDERTATVARLLQENHLGMVAQAYWPANSQMNAEIPKPIGDQSVEILQLSTRAGNCLRNAGIPTIRELIQQSRDQLMDLPNMGRTSVAEIEQKLSGLTVNDISESESVMPPDWFSLAILMTYEKCGFPEKIAARLRSANIPDIHGLLRLMPEAVLIKARLKPSEMQTIQTRLVSFGLRLGFSVPDWATVYLNELRAAFIVEIENFTDTTEVIGVENSTSAVVASLPNCLEEELEQLVPSKNRDQKLPIVRRVLGWDGGSGTTLEVAGSEFDRTRERVRQIVASLHRPSMNHTLFLGRAIDLIGKSTPCSVEKAEATLREGGVVRTSIRPEGILATARLLGLSVPWDIEEGGSLRVVVGPGDADRIKMFNREARRRVSHFGTTKISYVLAEIDGAGTTEFANLCCSLVAELKWLDEEHDWFWLPTQRNAIASRLAKILRVVPNLDIHEALLGVLRDRRMHDTELPLGVFRSFCNLMSWCEVEDDRVLVSGELPIDDDYDSNETILTGILRENGPVMWRSDLWHRASLRGVGKVSFDRYLSESNMITRLGTEMYGLIGSVPVESMVASKPAATRDEPANMPITPIIEVQQVEKMSVAFTPEPFLMDCDPAATDFPFQVLKCCLVRSAPLRQRGIWSLIELQWADEDFDLLRKWSQIGMLDSTEIRRKALTYGSTRVDGTEALALTFLACCSDIAMARADESEMWLTIQSAFGPDLRARLFLESGYPKAWIREATERICSRLRIRHVFGREGEQSWRRTVFLQFGLTRNGWTRLPWWLTYSSTVPVAVEDLLSSPTLCSESFGELWRVLQRFRAGHVSNAEAVSALVGNPWIAASEVQALLSSAVERRDLSQSGEADTRSNHVEPDRLLGPPLLFWNREVPVFEIPVMAGARWLTEPRHVFVLHNGKRVPATRQDDGYRLDGKLEFELADSEVTVDLRLKQVSCLPEPLHIYLTPEDSDYVFYDLASGKALSRTTEIFLPDHPYALLAKSSLEVSVEPIEMRRVFNGVWTLRAYRHGVPPTLRISGSGDVVWDREDSGESSNPRPGQRFQVTCMGGRWGESTIFAVERLPEFTPTSLLISGRRFPIEKTDSGPFRASIRLMPDMKLDSTSVRVECISRNRVRWLGAQLAMGPVHGTAIETEDGWKLLREKNDMDAEYLRVHRLVTRLPSRFEGEDISIDDWAWMEGPHFCGRPRTSASLVGGTVHAVGEPLRLTPGPYNRGAASGEAVARSVIHSGVVKWIDSPNGTWAIQFRKSFELGSTHDIWEWRLGSETPHLVDRRTWRQDDDVCYVQIDDAAPSLGFAVSFDGFWLGARTSEQGWAGFKALLSSCSVWRILAQWLKWWRVPLLHPLLRTDAAVLAKKEPIETLQSWISPMNSTLPVRFSEDYEDSWRMVTQTLLWDWLPTPAEAGKALVTLGLLTGDTARDFDESWTGFKEMCGVHPLLFVQIAARGAAALYPDRSIARALLEKLRNTLLEIDIMAPLDTVSRALRDIQQMAARAMAVDEAFVARSVLRDAVGLVSGDLRSSSSHNLRVALANSYAVPQFIAATILHKMINGELS